MAEITANLVLRGVAVLLGGKAVEARLGSGYRAKAGAPAVPVSMRQPSQVCAEAEFTEPESWPVPVDQADVDQGTTQAGRPVGTAGVPVRRSPAILAGRTAPTGRFPATVAVLSAERSGRHAVKRGRRAGSDRQQRHDKAISPQEVPPAGRLTRSGSVNACGRLTAEAIRLQPATRTPPASTRGGRVFGS